MRKKMMICRSRLANRNRRKREEDEEEREDEDEVRKMIIY